jgi:hypothetical protein
MKLFDELQSTNEIRLIKSIQKYKATFENGTQKRGKLVMKSHLVDILFCKTFDA